MKIIYLGNFNNKESDATEKHIKFALEELGHEVIPIDEQKFLMRDILDIKNPDMFLFHKGGLSFGFPFESLLKILNYLTCKKVCWFFDKIIGDRENYIDIISGYVDYVFVSDDTWRRRHKYNNMHCLRQGIGNEDAPPVSGRGIPLPEYQYDVVFTGNVYPPRDLFVDILKEAYRDKFKVFNNVFGRNLYDLCASVKIIVAPPDPSDEFYWSSRIYMILGSGGFLVHPVLHGLKEEFQEGRHFAGYKGLREMKETIDYFLKPENEIKRKTMKMSGWKHCIANFTYKDRMIEMLKAIGEYGDKTPKRASGRPE